MHAMDYQQNAEAERPQGIIRKSSHIENNFRYHKPGEAVERKHEQIRSMLGAIAEEMNRLLPGGREAQLVQTKLEEAMFWANAAVARNQ
jgi:hypothetical protein